MGLEQLKSILNTNQKTTADINLLKKYLETNLFCQHFKPTPSLLHQIITHSQLTYHQQENIQTTNKFFLYLILEGQIVQFTTDFYESTKKYSSKTIIQQIRNKSSFSSIKQYTDRKVKGEYLIGFNNHLSKIQEIKPFYYRANQAYLIKVNTNFIQQHILVPYNQTLNQKQELLKKLPLFTPLLYYTNKLLACHMQLISTKPFSALYYEGDNANCFYVVKQGKLKIDCSQKNRKIIMNQDIKIMNKVSRKQKQIILYEGMDQISIGMAVGYDGIFYNQTQGRIASVKTYTSCQLYYLKANKIKPIIQLARYLFQKQKELVYLKHLTTQTDKLNKVNLYQQLHFNQARNKILIREDSRLSTRKLTVQHSPPKSLKSQIHPITFYQPRQTINTARITLYPLSQQQQIRQSFNTILPIKHLICQKRQRVQLNYKQLITLRKQKNYERNKIQAMKTKKFIQEGIIRGIKRKKQKEQNLAVKKEENKLDIDEIDRQYVECSQDCNQILQNPLLFQYQTQRIRTQRQQSRIKSRHKTGSVNLHRHMDNKLNIQINNPLKKDNNQIKIFT